MSEVPWTEASAIGSEAAHATWSLAARMRLEEVAGVYHGTVAAAELAEDVQRRSRIRTRQPHRHWLNDVLYRTMVDNDGRGEPFLAALCVDATGRVGSGYAGCVEHLRGVRVADADEQAVSERLSCYRWFGAQLPPGGGEPGPLPQPFSVPEVRVAGAARTTGLAPRRTRAAVGPGAGSAAGPATGSGAAGAARPGRVAKTDVMPAVCPRCFLALPVSGLCDNCD